MRSSVLDIIHLPYIPERNAHRTDNDAATNTENRKLLDLDQYFESFSARYGSITIPGMLPLHVAVDRATTAKMEMKMPILLWLLGVPIPVIILLLLLWH